MSHLISFEGVEGCGKTTQLELAAQFLRNANIPVLTTEEPGGTPLGGRIRKLLLNRGSFDICAEAETLRCLAARAGNGFPEMSPMSSLTRAMAGAPQKRAARSRGRGSRANAHRGNMSAMGTSCAVWFCMHMPGCFIRPKRRLSGRWACLRQPLRSTPDRYE